QARDPVVSQAHPLAGGRLPRGQLILADGTAARIYQLFHDGRFVLLESGGSAASAASAASAGLPGPVRAVSYQRCSGARLPPAVLVRPDGYVAWASAERDRLARERAARAAIGQWCVPA
ncbi:MAG TPA: hypothetical protein VII22_28830, partial [Streptosporangiaceae bacterium]